MQEAVRGQFSLVIWKQTTDLTQDGGGGGGLLTSTWHITLVWSDDRARTACRERPKESISFPVDDRIQCVATSMSRGINCLRKVERLKELKNVGCDMVVGGGQSLHVKDTHDQQSAAINGDHILRSSFCYCMYNPNKGNSKLF